MEFHAAFLLRTRLVLALCAAALLSLETASHAAKNETVNESDTRKSTARKIESDLDQIDRENLSKRIQLLELLDSIETDSKARSHQLLAEAKSKKAAALAAVTTAAAEVFTWQEAIERCKAFAPYYAADKELKRALRNSFLVNTFRAELQRRASSSTPEQALALLDTLKSVGLLASIEDLCDITLRDSLSRSINRSLKTLENDSSKLPAEKTIFGYLVGAEAKPTLDVAIQQAEDPSLEAALVKSLQQRWGNSFELVFKEFSRSQEPAPNADFQLLIALDSFRLEKRSTDKLLQSRIPGSIVAKENPAFTKALQAYKNADRDYEEALEQYYDHDHEDFLRRRQEVEDYIEVGDLTSGGELVPEESSGRDDESQFTEPRLRSLNEERVFQGKVNAKAKMLNLDQAPEKPEPPHEERWKIVQETPPTIVESQNDTPYQYTSRTIAADFSAEGTLTFLSPASPSNGERREVSKNYSTQWVQNLEVHPKDNSVHAGNYSESSINSELHTFAMDFSASYSRELKNAIDASIAKFANDADARSISTALALKLSEAGSKHQPIDIRELTNLAKTLAQLDASPVQLRTELFATAARIVGVADLFSQKKIATALEAWALQSESPTL